ncbi:hypothetical protein H4582DRAFT_487108 [Lactarius indigo]|nr:hypothetical protein H4582DRAFT_487108 [Lactarius indigo]
MDMASTATSSRVVRPYCGSLQSQIMTCLTCVTTITAPPGTTPMGTTHLMTTVPQSRGTRWVAHNLECLAATLSAGAVCVHVACVCGVSVYVFLWGNSCPLFQCSVLNGLRNRLRTPQTLVTVLMTHATSCIRSYCSIINYVWLSERLPPVVGTLVVTKFVVV